MLTLSRSISALVSHIYFYNIYLQIISLWNITFSLLIGNKLILRAWTIQRCNGWKSNYIAAAWQQPIHGGTKDHSESSLIPPLKDNHYWPQLLCYRDSILSNHLMISRWQSYWQKRLLAYHFYIWSLQYIFFFLNLYLIIALLAQLP